MNRGERGRYGQGGANPGGGATESRPGRGRPNRPEGGGGSNVTAPGGGGEAGGRPGGRPGRPERPGVGGGGGGTVGNGRPRPPNWNRPPRNWDRAQYRRNFRAPQRWHWGVYTRPPGWFYRRWTYGMILPALFWTRNFWIDSWWEFDLPIPPYGYRWVRVDNDALLINTATGEVLQVQYDAFY